jgi:hypothetical protein
MSNLKFSTFKTAVQKKFEELSQHNLFKTNVGKDELWEFYLNSFPEGTNKIFKERREYDCQSCKQFIRVCGNVVAIIDNEPVSIWDITVDGYYQEVASKMADFVRSFPVKDVFYHGERDLGTDFNRQILEDGQVIKWEHFFFRLPKTFVKKNVAHDIGECRSTKEVFQRGLDEITFESAEMVIELIDQNSLYRGEENRTSVDFFLKHKKAYSKLPDEKKDYYTWDESLKVGPAARVRNTAIGTLLVDLSEGMELDQAVKSFETKVAPMNYKRPTALITKGMIKKAEDKVEELGISDSLARRYAVAEDITINNVLFANREAKKAMSVFDELAAETKEDAKKFDHVESVDIETFVKNILPKAESIELMLENKHVNNLMSLIAPVNKDAKGIFKWGNNFSWAYNGDVTDSIKERVKKAGGDVSGVLRCSLSWFNYDDLDIHMVEPDGNHIYFSNRGKFHRSSGMLDVDMNAGGGHTREGVENITYSNLNKMQEGQYQLFINQFALRERVDNGFDCEIEFDGKIYSFHYDKLMKSKENIVVAKFNFTRKNGIEIIESLPSSQSNKEAWGIVTNHFHKVSMVMHSPNHWDGEKTGNKHYFFILEGCKNDGRPRGFFNEFLSNDLIEHRKVFEVLGSKMKVPESERQLSGAGFSSTVRNEIICKVSGSFSRSIKLIF